MPDFYARMITAEPMIVIGGNGNGLLGPARAIGSQLSPGARALFLVNFWNDPEPNAPKNIGYEIAGWKKEHPNQHFLFLANDLLQLEKLRKAGIPSILGNHNLFISEDDYVIDTSGHKKFDAIYNGRMSPMKRHELCSDIQSLAFLYYFMPSKNYERYDLIKSTIPHATYLNGDPHTGEYRHFTKKQCVEWYGKSRVGLCLSASEGAMLASMEYLMSGLPVLTTPSRGGRSHFFRPDFSAEVDPTPQSVAQGVQVLASRNLNPEDVRTEVLRIVAYEREKLFEDVQRYLMKIDFDIDFKKAFWARFVDKMWETYRTSTEFFERNDVPASMKSVAP